ncbi:MAG TPA: GGDEF domain-containing protein [Lacipirellula sp.]
MNEAAKTADAALSGLLVVDADGRLLAGDIAASGLLAEGPGAPRSLQEIAGGHRAAEALRQIAEGQPEITIELGPTAMRIRRLAGPSGVIALVSFLTEAEGLPHDGLTGLPDRRAIPIRLHAWRSSTTGRRHSYAVLFLDLDNFKRINDEHGHAAGDRVLVAVAQRLLHCVRDGDLVVRYGGDEFLLLLRGVETSDAAQPVIERLRQCLVEPIAVDSAALHVSASVGVAIGDLDSRTIEDAIDAADRDMYAHKRRRPK